jgi:hypothetical protein
MAIIDQIKTSTLSLTPSTGKPDTMQGALPTSTNQTVTDLAKSQLDLGVANPEKYLDKKPQ